MNKQPEWKLTDEEIEEVIVGSIVILSSEAAEQQAIIEAQAKKLVAWLLGAIDYKMSSYYGYIVPRKALEQLRREVGLDTESA